MAVRIPNAGDAPISGSGAFGDLLVRVNVARSKVFERQGSNIFYNAKIPFYTALLGGKVRVPTLDGDVDVRVPGGTQPGEEMVLKGRGIPALYSTNAGDLFVKFGVSVPRYVLLPPLCGLSRSHNLQGLDKATERTHSNVCRRS